MPSRLAQHEHYQYSALRNPEVDIRLLELLPGKLDNVIRVHIFHAPLRPSAEPTSNGSSLSEIQKTLPPGWSVYETVEGRYIFHHADSDISSWEHPDPELIPLDHKLSDNGDVRESGLVFEALSYTW
jgi:hypothetical protein